MEKTKIFLSDPQVLFREGIHFILSGEDDFEVVGETTGNEEAYTNIFSSAPGIALLSMQDPKVSGAEITRRIKRTMPSISIILTIEEKSPESIFTVMKSGASACITKNTDPNYLLDLFRVVVQGSNPIIDEMISPEIGNMILEYFNDITAINGQVDNLLPCLNETETQLIKSITAENDIEQIAEKFSMSESEIRRGLRLVLNKLISNEQSLALIEAVQRNIPMLARHSAQINAADFVTRAEFNEFKAQFMERLRVAFGQPA
jgi:two-component system, NarL family, response regulator DevR